MQMTTRQLKLLNLMINLFHGRGRKYNLEPYWFHLMRVAMRSNPYLWMGGEIGLCHDCIEDLNKLNGFPYDYSLAHLTQDLEAIGYDKKEIDEITTGVYHLTDVYTKEAFPNLTRAARKKLEAERLWKIPARFQNVKYADLEDNTGTIVPYDKAFAATYLPEKDYILQGMNKGDQEFYNKLVVSVTTHIQDIQK